jgi:hypothetical protein
MVHSGGFYSDAALETLLGGGDVHDEVGLLGRDAASPAVPARPRDQAHRILFSTTPR